MADARSDGGSGREKAAVEGRASFVEGWEFMQTLGEGAYGELVDNLYVCVIL